MDKDELLNLLDDGDVQRKILAIVNGEKDTQADYAEEKFSELKNLRGENYQLKNNLARAQQRVKDLEQRIQTAQSENYRLENDLSEAQRRVKNLEQQFQTAQYRNSRLENSLSQSEKSSRSLQKRFEDWQSSFDIEHQRANNLERELKEANIKLMRLNAQLNDRFDRGWELFQKYKGVGSHARQLLQGVFPHENFTSFICGGAQTDSLETLWDVLRECIMNGNQHDAEILREIFEYCLELVNASKVQSVYSILPVNVGDRFDFEVHSEAPGSRAQGKISSVWLPGYRNDYNGRIIRKSIVQVS